MLCGAALDAIRTLPLRGFQSAFGTGRVLVVAPHPDDESLGCGGLIAEACAHGQPPLVAILTDGAGSHLNSRAYPPARLRALREQEARDATAALGLPPENLVFLRHEDSAAPTTGPAFARAIETLSSLIRQLDCTTVAVSWRHDPHCDHAAAAAIAAAACYTSGARLLEYPVWGWTLPADGPIDTAALGGFRLDVSRHLPRKRAAIMAHLSQHAGIIDDDPDGFQLSSDFIEFFLSPTEAFIETAERT